MRNKPVSTLQPTTSSLSAPLIDSLREQVTGPVIARGDAAYDEARRAWNLVVDQHPHVIVDAHNTADVVTAVRFARDADLGIAVMGTGHGTIRPADDAVLIRTAQLNEVRIDPDRQTAWIGSGAQWYMVLGPAQEHGLTPLVGSSSHVGVTGYTLGGGMGWLARKYGLATDSVHAFEVVTAQGDALRVSATEHPDLFWGLRGGGGSLAIVTGMEIQLYPVSTVYAGSLLYPIEMAREVMTRFREWTADAPEELTSAVLLFNFPPLPQVPAPLQGKSFVMVRGCYCGPVEEGEELMRFWRDWRAPAMDMFQPLPFTQADAISQDPVDPMPAFETGAWLSGLDDRTIDAFITHAAGQPGLVFAEIRHAGGAIARGSDNVFQHRHAPYVFNIIGIAPTHEAHEGLARHCNQLKAAIAHQLDGVYMNFIAGEESWERAPDAYRPEDYRRLAQHKSEYDPDNRLRYSFHVDPA